MFKKKRAKETWISLMNVLKKSCIMLFCTTTLLVLWNCSCLPCDGDRKKEPDDKSRKEQLKECTPGLGVPVENERLAQALIAGDRTAALLALSRGASAQALWKDYDMFYYATRSHHPLDMINLVYRNGGVHRRYANACRTMLRLISLMDNTSVIGDPGKSPCSPRLALIIFTQFVEHGALDVLTPEDQAAILQYAVLLGNGTVVEYLLDLRPRDHSAGCHECHLINPATVHEGRSIVLTALESRNQQLVMYFIRAGLAADQELVGTTVPSDTLLHMAIRMGLQSTVKYLLTHHASLRGSLARLRNIQGDTPYSIARACGNATLCDLMLGLDQAHECNISRCFDGLGTQGKCSGERESSHATLTILPHVGDDEHPILRHHAGRSITNTSITIPCSAALPASPTHSMYAHADKSPLVRKLYRAIKVGCLSEAASILNQDDARIIRDQIAVRRFFSDNQATSFFDWAVQSYSRTTCDILELLYHYGPYMYSESPESALPRAIIRNHYDVFELFVLHAEVKKENIGYLLWLAVRYRRKHIVEQLLGLVRSRHAGLVIAPPNATYRGQSIILVAAERGDSEIVRLFLDAGFEVDQPLQGGAVEGDRLLHVAIRGEHMELVRLLLENYALPNNYEDLMQTNARRETPLLLLERRWANRNFAEIARHYRDQIRRQLTSGVSVVSHALVTYLLLALHVHIAATMGGKST